MTQLDKETLQKLNSFIDLYKYYRADYEAVGQFHEEMGELIQATNKYFNRDKKHYYENVIEELVDVMFQAQEIIYMLRMDLADQMKDSDGRECVNAFNKMWNDMVQKKLDKFEKRVKSYLVKYDKNYD